MTGPVNPQYGAPQAPGYGAPAVPARQPSGARWITTLGPLPLAALGIGALGLLLALASLLLPVYQMKGQTYSSTWYLLDYGVGFIISVMAVIVALIVATLANGRNQIAVRAAGGAMGLIGLVNILALVPRASGYVSSSNSGNTEAKYQVHQHISAGFFVALAAAVLLIAACALMHRGQAAKVAVPSAPPVNQGYPPAFQQQPQVQQQMQQPPQQPYQQGGPPQQGNQYYR